MKFVIVESPFATNTIALKDGAPYEALEADNVLYARACLHDCLVNFGEAPYASHLLYTQDGILNDAIPEERTLGIKAGLEIGEKAELRVFYLDRGFSSGMQWGLRAALDLGQKCAVRRLGGAWDVGCDATLDLDQMIKIARAKS